MQQIDVLLALTLPILILTHLIVAPYTKVEESFNIQAIHDISNYGLPMQNISSSLQRDYDHFEFPGAVPRTFVGALALAGISKPWIGLIGTKYAQLVVRAVLGLFNAYALLRYKSGLEKAFGRNVGRWYVLLQASQFHVIFYASRTLPNMFAFGLTTIAMGELLPSARPLGKSSAAKKQKLAIFLFVFAGAVFRSEIAILLSTQLLLLLLQSRTDLKTLFTAGVASAVLALAVSIPIDSYFWQRPIWPEFAGFYYNAVQGKSADWGTSPLTFYFTSLLPKLLLNPLIMILLIPLAFALPATKQHARDLVIPPALFVAIYSLQPHKEARFIIYAVPPLTAAASLSAAYIWTRRSKSILYIFGSLVLATSIAGSFIASSGMLLISSLNYPGGVGLAQLHSLLDRTPWPEDSPQTPEIRVHMDVLSCMTGVTRFLQLPLPSTSQSELPVLNGRAVQMHYDKTEDPEELARPEFWARFDYLLMEAPERAIGKWEVVESVFAYSGIEFLRPGDGSSFSENLENIYAANNITKEGRDGVKVAPDSEDVKKAIKDGVDIEEDFKTAGDGNGEDLGELKAQLLLKELSQFGTFKLVRDAVRQVTGGWWVGPRMEPKIRIMRRVKDPLH